MTVSSIGQRINLTISIHRTWFSVQAINTFMMNLLTGRSILYAIGCGLIHLQTFIPHDLNYTKTKDPPTRQIEVNSLTKT